LFVESSLEHQVDLTKPKSNPKTPRVCCTLHK